MKDIEKLMLVYYVSVNGMSQAMAIAKLAEIENHYNKQFDDGIKVIYVPTFGDTKLEVLHEPISLPKQTNYENT